MALQSELFELGNKFLLGQITRDEFEQRQGELEELIGGQLELFGREGGELSEEETSSNKERVCEKVEAYASKRGLQWLSRTQRL